MRFIKLKYGLILYGFLQFVVSFQVYAQSNTNIIIKGTVVDVDTNEPIPFASIELLGTKTWTTTDMDGHYKVTTNVTVNKIRFSSLGYNLEIKSIAPGKSQIINAKMRPTIVSINEIVIKSDKKRYKNKKNPAVELIEMVIENKSKNRKEGLDSYEYEKYEKTQFALSNFSDKLKQRKALRKFRFVFDNVDSTTLAGSKILPVYLKETLSDYYYRKSPRQTREIVKANKMVSFEGWIIRTMLTPDDRYKIRSFFGFVSVFFMTIRQMLPPLKLIKEA